MSNLNSFLKQNAIPVEGATVVASKRFLDEKKKPIEWKLKSITPSEDEALRKSATKRVPVPGKKHQFTTETDYGLYMGRLAVACTVFPDLTNAELQNSYGVMGEEALLKAMLTPGEYADYLTAVNQVNGYETPFEEIVEDAKNG